MSSALVVCEEFGYHRSSRMYAYHRPITINDKNKPPDHRNCDSRLGLHVICSCGSYTPYTPCEDFAPSVNWYFKQSEVACGVQNYINNIVQLFTNLMKSTLKALMRDMLEYTPSTSGSLVYSGISITGSLYVAAIPLYNGSL